MLLHSIILGEGKPLVIIHGFLGMSDNWKTLGNKFSEAGYQVHLIDQRNHGKSFHDNTFNYDVLVEDLKTYCDALFLDEMILLGHSMGGKTAMHFATKYPEQVEKLIVADIAPKYYPIHHDTILEGLQEIDNTELDSRRKADEILSKFVRDKATRQFLLKNLFWKEKGKLALRLNIASLKENVSEVGERLPNSAVFKKDTLFLRGDRSEYITINDYEQIKQHFPNAKIETISNAGHWLHAENPEEFYNTVLNFLNE